MFVFTSQYNTVMFMTDTYTKFSIIVACTANGGIGKDNKIPWYIPNDLKHFKKVTTNCPEGKMNVVIMGRNTWESLPKKPLPARINVIVSTHLSRSHCKLDFDKNDNIYVVQSLDEALELVASMSNRVHETFVIGGSRLYKEALEHEHCDKAYVTHIVQDYDCDVFVPLSMLHKSFSLDKCNSSSVYATDNKLCTFHTYLRN